jgi:hypothetical protein
MSRVTLENTVGCHEVALVEALGGVGAAGEERGTLVDALLDEATDAVALRGRHERPEPAGLLERVARRERRSGGRGDLLGLGEALARHDHAGERRAGLARVEEALADTVGDGLGEVGVVEDDVGALAAELERDLLDGLAGHLGDALAGAGRLPVKLTMSTSAWAAMASPTTGPTPVTRLNTPAGRPASSMTSARMKALMGATSLGFSTTVLPAANAGATLSAIWCSG